MFLILFRVVVIMISLVDGNINHVKEGQKRDIYIKKYKNNLF